MGEKNKDEFRVIYKDIFSSNYIQKKSHDKIFIDVCVGYYIYVIGFIRSEVYNTALLMF